MKRKILFRADGNSSTGLGHLYRLFSLVEMVKKKYEFQFLTQENSTTEVIPTEYNFTTIPSHIEVVDEPHWLADHFEPSEHLIIIDGYHFTTAYQKNLKELGYKLIYIDDLAKIEMVADVVINHSPYVSKTDFNKHTETKLALGTRYALLRPKFLKAAWEKPEFKAISTAFVCFGGADPLNLSFKAVKALLDFDSIEHIYVVLGAAYTHENLSALQEKYANRITLHKNLSEKKLAKVMKSCNFGIVPASTILYELCCFKMPILSGFFVDNQELIYKGFLNRSAIFKGGDFKEYTILDFKTLLEELFNRDDFSSQITAQEHMFDKNIKTRHLKLIKALCSN